MKDLRVAVIAAVVAWLAGGCATVDQDDLSSHVDQIHSDATEGVVLAGERELGRVPVSFAWLQAGELQHHVSERSAAEHRAPILVAG